MYYVVPVKSKVEISQNFVAFSEYINFKCINKIVTKLIFSLLNTLGENDYVNVAGFTENATWVTTCLGDGLVQANARNKRLLFDGIDQLQDRAIAYFGKALEFAYEKLENFEPTRESNQNGAGMVHCLN